MQSAARMKVRIDADRCEGHGRCYVLAPELFEPDEIGNSHERGSGEVEPQCKERAFLAARNCPEHAVIIEEST
ncbi:MAG: ferredoxin [Acidimicrobiaceae bacterium]